MRRGRLIGVGVGPGDPELLTLKAVRAVERATAVAFIAAAGRASRAREIVAGHIRHGARELIAVMPMTQDPEATGRAYSQLATGIVGELGRGTDVVFLCEGDPLLYGSFAHLLAHLANRFECEVIPGITSLGAAAAAALHPLAMGEEPLVIAPATMSPKRLAALLQASERVVLLKVGRHLGRAKEALTAARFLEGAVLIENVTLATERVRPLAAVEEHQAPYFSHPRRAETARLMDPAPAILVLGRRTLGLARRLTEALPGASIHAPHNSTEAVVPFARAADRLRELFQDGRPTVAVCAAGIVVRALAPLLADKRGEPPVVVVAEDGSCVVPLLGGHRGANELARRAAAVLGAYCATTTAGDLRFGIALDAPPPGWRLAAPDLAKPFMARLLDEMSVRLVAEAGDPTWLLRSRLPMAEAAPLAILSTHRAVAPTPDLLVYHPPVLALGVGAERGASPEALADLVDASLARADLAPDAVAVVVSIDFKEDEPAVQALAARLGVPARFFTSDRLVLETDRLSERSAAVHRATGCWGVAEGAALAAAGPDARLVVPKQRGAGVTCAVALAPQGIDAAATGRARGRLAIVGLGPGAADWRTSEAQRLIEQADELVGYGLYLELVGAAASAKPAHAFPLGAESERCRFALARAAEGRSVALVCSGDPGIYALATLVMEILATTDEPAVARVELVVAPGVSAMQAAAARVGAPLGHDFCAISLSDLLTPWPVIERRLEAAATGDFVVALYNPVSARRRSGLGRARDILLAHRAATTPVAICRNLGRPEECVRLIDLAGLAPELVDMLCVVLIGSTATRRLPRRHGPDLLYTPRGYDLA